MAAASINTVVGVFDSHERGQQAVNELKRRGFSDTAIGVAARHVHSDRPMTPSGAVSTEDDTYASEGTVAGLATGAGVGALWGLGIIAGVLPAIGPAIAGGTLAAILSSAAAGAATAGLGGCLIGLGMSKEEAEFYDSEFRSGRTIVTVTAPGREAEVAEVFRSLGGYDIHSRSSGTVSTSAPVTQARGVGASESQASLAGTHWSESGDAGKRVIR